MSEEIKEQLTPDHVVEMLCSGRTQGEVKDILERKVRMAAIVMLELEAHYMTRLASKGTLDNVSEVFLCRIAGNAEAWLSDIQ